MSDKIKIGVSGNRGSFSEEAANYYARRENITDYEIKYLISVANVLQALKAGEIERGIFPIENSNGGIVTEAVYAMSRVYFHDRRISSRLISSTASWLNPAPTTGSIKTIASHQQALKQCRMYLKRKWGETELKEYSDTAEAAKDLSEGKLDPDTAVIAPRICAELYGLEILEEGIQDLKFNFTSFISAVK